MNFDRQSGVFLHIASLPGPDGVGTLGAPARRFVDFLARADQRMWQFCPIGPTSTEYGNSPYSSFSAFAGNPLFVDLDRLHEAGWLTDDDLADRPELPEDAVDYERVTWHKMELLERAFDRFQAEADDADRAALESFREANDDWLPDYALFMALKDHFDQATWTEWPADARDRDPDALAGYREDLSERIEFRTVSQYWFDEQWNALQSYANERGVSLVGDMPIYVGHDSADVWANRDAFQLDDRGEPVAVAGVPDAPDEPFSAQRWGSPVYDWEALEESGFAWWIQRFERLFERVDLVRIDHFRGLEQYWAIPADEPNPNVGEWRDVPSEAFFDTLLDALGDLPVFAEDIGHLTEAVHELRRRYGFPSLRLAPFAGWCDPGHKHKPDQYPENSVAYTSTHDTNTVRGYYHELDEDERACLHEYFDLDADAESDVHWTVIDAVWRSDAVLAFAQLQDVLGLGSDARFNVPGTTEGNWAWRVTEDQLDPDAADELAEVTRAHDR